MKKKTLSERLEIIEQILKDRDSSNKKEISVATLAIKINKFVLSHKLNVELTTIRDLAQFLADKREEWLI